jgi:23S rRNA (pseudouridine1915-N3)-methyltransferase
VDRVERLQVLILAIGRCREACINDLVATYMARTPWHVRLQEIVSRKGEDVEAEATRLLAAVPERALVVALDERGEDLASADLAGHLGHWRDDGVRAVAFLIGGADGLAARVRERAALLLAFGRMTWPHQLVRLMLAEQLYRAATILAGHPYHRA